MITLEFVSSQWDSLDKRADLVAAHQFDHIVMPYGSPLIVKDVNGIHHLLIPIGENDKAHEDKRSSGVHIKISNWGESGELRKFIDVICLKPHLNELFDMIVLDILKGFEVDISTPDKTCREVINKWRELLSRDPVNLPDKNSLVGIFGELWVLRALTQMDPNAVDLWVGPQGARFDFINIDKALEVKTTLQRKGCKVTIHGEKQLEPMEESKLFLSVLKFEEVPVGGESIIDIVNDIVNEGADRSILFSKLINVSITATNMNDCSYLRLKLVEEKTYSVDENFPSITTKSFKRDRLPNGVVDLIYQIDLSSEPPSPLSKRQAEWIYQEISRGGL